MGVVQEMKRQVHQCLLGLSLFVIIPGALFGILLAVAAVGSGFQSGFAATNFLAVPVLMIPALLAWWGIKLFLSLYAGFLARSRTMLFWFYSVTTAYFGLWLISTFNRDGLSGTIFSLQEQVFGLMLLLIPLLAVGFTKPDFQPNPPTKNEEAQQAAPCNTH